MHIVRISDTASRGRGIVETKSGELPRGVLAPGPRKRCGRAWQRWPGEGGLLGYIQWAARESPAATLAALPDGKAQITD